MPCYQVNTISVSFKAAHRELLDRAINALGWQSTSVGNMLRVTTPEGMGITLDLRAGKAVMEGRAQGRLNELKRQYSKMAVLEVARRNGWQLQPISAMSGVFARAF